MEYIITCTRMRCDESIMTACTPHGNAMFQGLHGTRELEALNRQMKMLEDLVRELMHVNSQWDLEYREQEEAFRRYREDSQLATKENHETIARLKEENEALKMKLRNKESGRREREPFKLGANVASRSCGKQSGDEVELLRQQLKVYQEDFDLERREKERLKEEKENERLRLQAEVTSLQLQLDRCRTELSYYSSETTRLAHQLKIKCQADQEQYTTYLRNKGYVPRSSDEPLPHLDPFVEEDSTAMHSDCIATGSRSFEGKPLSPSHHQYCTSRDSNQSPWFPDISSHDQLFYSNDVGVTSNALGALSQRSYSCPKCARVFVKRTQLEEHKIKCLQY